MLFGEKNPLCSILRVPISWPNHDTSVALRRSQFMSRVTDLVFLLFLYKLVLHLHLSSPKEAFTSHTSFQVTLALYHLVIHCWCGYQKYELSPHCIDQLYMFPILVRYVICWHPVYIHNKNLLVNQTHAQNMYFRLFEKTKTLKLNSDTDGRMGSKLAFTESSKSSSRAHFTQSCSRLLYYSGASIDAPLVPSRPPDYSQSYFSYI